MLSSHHLVTLTYKPITDHTARTHAPLTQPSATSPPFFDNLHFEHFDKSVNHKSTLKCLSKCSKWRLSKKGGLVADGCFNTVSGLRACSLDATLCSPKRRCWKDEQKTKSGFSKHFSTICSPNLCSPNEDFGRIDKR